MRRIIKTHKKPKAKTKSKGRARAQASDLQEAVVHLVLSANPLPAFLWDLDTLRYIDVNEAAVK